MALCMLNTLKTTRLLNVFLTENYTKTWNVKWCPLTTTWMEIQHLSSSKGGDFTSASCGTAPWQRQTCGTSIPSGLSPLQGCQQRANTARRKDTSLCPVCLWRPGHTGEAAQRWPTYIVPVCYGVLWPGVVRKTEQTGKLQTTPAIQTERWKPVRTKSGVIKKTDWLRCNAAFFK